MARLLDWYLLGVALGLGVAVGAAGNRPDVNRALVVGLVALLAVGAGVIAALVIPWAALAALAGVGIGVFSFRRLSSAAVPAAALALAGLAVVPLLGYAEAGLAPVLGRRLARRSAERYAGLRVLAKD
ncbi:MAG: hypothetical protein ICV74_01630 [Thermoleophilia bacterium]|nr:hypothetical protein [Thermoleophilia bacterium]